MGNETTLDKIRGYIGHIAWSIFLWSLRMTDEQYDKAVHIGCKPVTARVAELEAALEVTRVRLPYLRKFIEAWIGIDSTARLAESDIDIVERALAALTTSEQVRKLDVDDHIEAGNVETFETMDDFLRTLQD